MPGGKIGIKARAGLEKLAANGTTVLAKGTLKIRMVVLLLIAPGLSGGLSDWCVGGNGFWGKIWRGLAGWTAKLFYTYTVVNNS